MDSTRKSNADFCARTGYETNFTEADYQRAEDDIAAIALKYWGVGPIKAKRLIREAREAVT